jgi:mono/diheme cytochrome c family protein
MSAWGSPLSSEDGAALVAYLAATYGPDAGPFVPVAVPAEMAAAELAPLPDGPFTNGDAARGRTMFAATCAPCHGATARGQIGVSLVDRPLIHRAEDIARVVRMGRGLMPPMPLTTDAQIADIVAFLRDLRGT